MKTKIISALTCLALGFSLYGCMPPKKPASQSQDGSTITEDFDLPITDSQEPPPQTETESPPTQTRPETPPQSDIPIKAVETDTLLRCTASRLNVRQGAGTGYAAIGSLDKGDMVMPVSKNGDWYKILYFGASAYISASHVTEAAFEKSDDRIEAVIAEGKKLLGLPYVYGAQRYHFGNGTKNPSYDGKSYDCSSLMQYIFKIGANIDLAMTSREQSLQGAKTDRGDIRRGDLLFFTNASRFNKTGLERIGHVALYLGNNTILHTASDHAVIEAISDLRSSYYVTARRLIS